MRVDLTDEELTTIMAALEGYRDLMKDRFHWNEEHAEADQQEASSAEWCWQKLLGFQHDSRNSTTDNVIEGVELHPVDPLTLPTWTD